MKRKSLFTILFVLIPSILTLTACGKEITVTPQNKLADNVILVDDLSLTLESTDGTVSRYSYSGIPPIINPGDILLSGEGEGYLLKVVSVQDLGGMLEVTVEQAALEEAFEELHLQDTITMDSDINQLTAASVWQQGVMGKSGSIDVNIPVISFTGSGDYDVSVEGDFSFSPSVDIVIDISGKKLKTFRTELSGAAALDLDTVFEATTAVDVAPPELTLIGHGGIISPSPIQIFAVTITVPVGKRTIPVVVVSKFTLRAGVTFVAEDQATAEFGFTSNCTTSLGLEYQDSWNPVDHSATIDYSFAPNMSVDRPVALSIEAYVRPKVDTYLYGMLTPYFDHRISGRGSVVVEPEPKLEAELCLAGGAGAEVSKLSFGLASIYLDIFDFCQPSCPCPPTACNDGTDNDGDGYTDWPDDPGCFWFADTSEYGTNECDDGVDNDGDDLIDWPDDPGCTNITDTTESGEIIPACNDGIDNDGDGYTDWSNDPGCTDPNDVSELGTNECDDGVDNDGDTFTDWPDDPDCLNITDTSESETGDFDVVPIGHTLGVVNATFADGDYLYANFGGKLKIYNKSLNPGNPENIAEVGLSGSINEIYVKDGYAYIAVAYNALAIIDVSDPANPGTPVYRDTRGYNKGIYVTGGYAYVGAGASGLAIISVSSPTSPGAPVYRNTSGGSSGVYVTGGYAYVADGAGGLAIIDMSVPTSPGLPVYRDTSGYSRDVYVTGGYAYVANSADNHNTLAIIDVNDPANPGTPIYRNTSERSNGVYVTGGYAYVADGVAGLAIINVSDPANPGTPIYRDTAMSSRKVYVTGDYAYVAEHSGGLAIINVSDPTNPGTPVYQATGASQAVYVTGGYAYLANQGGSLAIVDVNDPANPGTPIYRDTSGISLGVYVTGGYAYLASYDAGLAIIDVSNPTSPGTPIYRDTSGLSRGVYVTGGYAYVADGASGLAIIDVSNPTNPGTPIYRNTAGQSYGVHVAGEYVYVADFENGLEIFRIW
jgi:hypothetical protein